MTMDRIDFAILDALQSDARISNKDLAGRVGLAPSSCLERVRKLRADQTIRSFSIEIDDAALGIGLQAMVTVQLNHNTLGDRLHTYRKQLMEMDEVVQVYHVAGVADFMVHMVVRDVDHLKSVGYEAFHRPEVAHIETSLIFDHDRAAAWPNLNA
jgi:DNA-binding Lrp family transcriptional regulator